jgi:hypothetical protein
VSPKEAHGVWPLHAVYLATGYPPNVRVPLTAVLVSVAMLVAVAGCGSSSSGMTETYVYPGGEIMPIGQPPVAVPPAQPPPPRLCSMDLSGCGQPPIDAASDAQDASDAVDTGDAPSEAETNEGAPADAVEGSALDASDGGAGDSGGGQSE